MARRKKKLEEVENHERWMVSYADFITLLFAFFVVMYSVSSVNEGKYRVLSSTLDGAFKGQPRTMNSIEIGDVLQNKALIERLMELEGGGDKMIPELFSEAKPQQTAKIVDSDIDSDQTISEAKVLGQLADNLESGLSPLIDSDLVSVKKNDLWVEIELNSKMLFGSGNASLSDEALRVLWQVAKPIRKLNNTVQVEGYTDNIPINSFEYPSNWELSAARSASVVHLLTKYGIDPQRLAAVGYGEHHPVEDNRTPEGRERNRRVVIVVQSNAISRFAGKRKSAQAVIEEPMVVEKKAVELQEAIELPMGNVSESNESTAEKIEKLEKAKNSRFNKFLN
ncbi:flagellar motor protein MotD [Cycloclasticus sp.]|uniref:flagellar motor protein MotD n=1 Tax=Cycloclasticus sp. TaxID=2024830 RepID=UPI000C0DBA2D|nr:flagellar motor protein MotD [Cycloclasticus sp.]PHR48570.1 MAG: MotB protein [Cycloclasticus sp.]